MILDGFQDMMKSIWDICDCDDVKSQYYISMNMYTITAYAVGIMGTIQLIPTSAFCFYRPKPVERISTHESVS